MNQLDRLVIYTGFIIMLVGMGCLLVEEQYNLSPLMFLGISGLSGLIFFICGYCYLYKME